MQFFIQNACSPEFIKNNIPLNATVFGGYGGSTEFNIESVKNAIRNVVRKRDDVYFVFMNFTPFDEHPQVKFFPGNYDLKEKSAFVDACDAMIHARLDGESFGLSIGEFSICNKPILTTYGFYNNHIKILGERAFIYTSKEELHNLFNIKNFKGNWNAYQEYTPDKVMEKFNKVFLNIIKMNIFIFNA